MTLSEFKNTTIEDTKERAIEILKNAIILDKITGENNFDTAKIFLSNKKSQIKNATEWDEISDIQVQIFNQYKNSIDLIVEAL